MDFLLQTFISAFKKLVELPPDIIEITLLTGKVALFSTLLSLVFGLPLGIYLYLSGSKFRKFLVVLVNTGMGAPPVAVGLLVFLLFSSRSVFGVLNILYTPAAIIIAETLLGIPVVAGLTFSAFASIPYEKFIQLLGFGANKFQAARVILYEARTGVLAAIIAAFGAVISEVGAALMVGGNIKHQTRILTTSIVLETRTGNYDLAIALALILFAITMLVTYLLTSIQDRKGDLSWHQRLWR